MFTELRAERVRFIATPFMPESQPALGVSTLVAVLAKRGIAADVDYLNLDYLRHVGRTLYSHVSDKIPVHYLLGEMLFAPALWGKDNVAWEDYQNYIMEYHARIGGQASRFSAAAPDGVSWDRLQSASEESPEIIRQWARMVLRDTPAIVGFTTTFQQNIASLALARELRRLVPREKMRIIFGGANCDADMGRAIADNFPFVDHVVSGEAEEVVAPLIEKIFDELSTPTPIGIEAPRFVEGQMVTDLSAMPIPDFKDYFTAIAEMDWRGDTRLVAEASRGCWWGEKMHCTFCGLNATTMNYRSKQPEQFIDEIATLRERYDRNRFAMADNILSLKYIDDAFRDLFIIDDKVRFFFETKSNLHKEQLEIMAAGGVEEIQPGIESLSTPILKLMKKGVSAIQNIQLLRWCAEFKIKCFWSLLWAFPGEPEEEYEKMAALMPKLFHLPAPMGAASIRLDRFSPYWKSPKSYGIENVKPYQSYDFAYPGIAADQRARMAYFFDYEHTDGRTPREYASQTLKAVDVWIAASKRQAALEFRDLNGETAILDTRETSGDEPRAISREAFLLLKALDCCRTRQSAFVEATRLASASGHSLPSEEFDALLNQLIERGWVIEEDKKVLSVVVDRTERGRVIDRKVGWRLSEIGLAPPETTLITNRSPP
jgi:ribosomal peptide maturation radical SAM protein 1